MTQAKDGSEVTKLASRVARTDAYKDIVLEYYDNYSTMIVEALGPSIHLSPHVDNQTMSEAVVALEKLICDEAGLRPGMRVLDVGCGVGGPTINIGKWSGATILGVNINAKQIEVAKKRTREAGLSDRVTYRVADAMAMPLPGASFDHAYSFECIYHTPDRKKLAREVARVLEPGAGFNGTDWMVRDGLSAADYEKWIDPICKGQACPYLVSLAEMRAALEEAGFEVELMEDLAERGSMEPNWVFFEQFADATAAPGTPDHVRRVGEGARIQAAAGRAGMFVIGHWRARKAR